jgi:hypothetical protein
MFVICTDSEEKEVHLITTLDNKEEDLLTLEYTKVSSTYNITDIKFCSQGCRFLQIKATHLNPCCSLLFRYFNP